MGRRARKKDRRTFVNCNSMKRFLHIAPSLRPEICGVGDYATTVGARMQQMQPGLECHFIAAGYRSAEQSQTAVSPEWFWSLVKRQVELSQPGDVSIILHYSGYGYSADGTPVWLADALCNRPPFAKQIQIVTFFHELYATGWPWRRAFWSSHRQRDVAKRIAQESDDLFTNRRESADWLEKITGRERGSVVHLPVPSNVGEPDEVSGVFDRPPQAILFGGGKVKQPFLRGSGALATARICKTLEIGNIVDVGSQIDFDRKPFTNESIEITQMGFLDSQEVSRCLLQSRIGFIDYNPRFITKSGVLAAFASHGVAVIGSRPILNAIDELEMFSETMAFEKIASSAHNENFGNHLAEYAMAVRRWSVNGSARRHSQLLMKAFATS